MNFELTKAQQNVYEIVDELGKSNFAKRAARYDEQAELPLENLLDFKDAGLLAATVGKDLGGLGGGALGEDYLLSLLIVEQTARYCLSTAQCIHIHFNGAHGVDRLGTQEQRERLLRPVVEEGALFNGTGSEPGRTARGLYNLQTVAEPVEGGYKVNGVKNYSTLADIVSYNSIGAIITGHAPPEGYLQLLVARDSPGYRPVPGSWNPSGMRGAVSPVVELTDVFVPHKNVLGPPGNGPRNRWQAKSHLSFAAQFIGGSEGIFDFLKAYIPQRGTASDGYTQLRMGEIRVAIDAARWLTYRAAWLWGRDVQAAELISMNAKYQAIQSAILTMDKAAQIAGSSAMWADSVLSRFVRDLRVQTLHNNQDKAAATVGKFHLGEPYDVTSRL